MRDLSRHPLFQVLLAINPPEPSLRLVGVDAEEMETEVERAGVDLFLFLQEREEAYDAVWEYSTDLFDAATIERMHRHLVRCWRPSSMPRIDRSVSSRCFRRKNAGSC